MVHALEEQYDSFTRNIGRTSLLAGSTDLPTADELGAEFERFLAQQGDDERPRLRSCAFTQIVVKAGEPTGRKRGAGRGPDVRMHTLQ